MAAGLDAGPTVAVAAFFFDAPFAAVVSAFLVAAFAAPTAFFVGEVEMDATERFVDDAGDAFLVGLAGFVAAVVVVAMVFGGGGWAVPTAAVAFGAGRAGDLAVVE